MKYLTIGILVLMIGNFVKAQDKSYYIGLNSGFSIPTGKYQNKNLDDGCFTLLGFNVGIEGAWFFSKHFGVGGQFGFNLHPVDVGPLGYEKVLNDPFLEDLTIRSDPYQILTGAIGIFYKWNFWKYLSLHSKLLGGIMWAKTPYQLYKPEYFIYGPEYYEITSSRDRNFMGLAGVGIQYDVTSCIAFRMEAEYQISKMIFGFKTTDDIIYEKRTISFINTSIALIFVL